VVLDLAESVLGGHRSRPFVEPAVAHLLDAAAHTAREVVMVTPLAEQERELSVLAAEGVGRAVVGQPLEVSVDGREAYVREPAVQLLRGHRAVGPPQGLEDRLALLGSPAHERKR
jgi:hypothetical protein